MVDHLPEDMIYELLSALLKSSPDDVFRFCTLNKRISKVCNRGHVRKTIIDRWTLIIQDLKEEARRDLGDAFGEDDIDLLIKSHLEDHIPEIPSWFLRAMNLD